MRRMVRVCSILAAIVGACTASARAQGKSKIEPKSGLELRWVAGGRFEQGCEAADTRCFADEKPDVAASVRPFWMAKTDVTVSMWSRCIAAGVCDAPATGGACNWQVPGRDRHPVNCITWRQAKIFCEWIGARLPTEQEWEFAAKGGGHRIYPWGDEPVSGARANYCDLKCHEAHPDWTWTDSTQNDGWPATSPVGTYPAGASRDGLLDMAGNAAQWTSTDGAEATKQAKGGGWDLYPRYLRNSAHVRLKPGGWFDNVTVRCAE